MTSAAVAARSLPLRFQVGARTIAAIRRDLVRVPLDLDAALAGRVPTLPPIDRTVDGYLVTSLPLVLLDRVRASAPGMIARERQRYTRRYTDLASGYDGWLAGLSGNARAGLRRKTRKLAAMSGGRIDARRYTTPAELTEFHALARELAAMTYQERLMGAGLPDTPDFVRTMTEMAGQGQVRAWLLMIDGRAVAYLYCPVHDRTVIYEYVGHDPALSEMSPGTVLHAEAMRDLFADPSLDRFDFTEGDGQHKRQFATGGVECVDLLLLRRTPANRAALAALAGFDGALALAKRGVQRLGAERWARKIRR